jgi:hypothetical protein
MAIRKGDLETLKALLAGDTLKPNYHNNNGICDAIETKQVEIVKFLLSVCKEGGGRKNSGEREKGGRP